jgi:hypothetical protein
MHVGAGKIPNRGEPVETTFSFTFSISTPGLVKRNKLSLNRSNRQTMFVLLPKTGSWGYTKSFFFKESFGGLAENVLPLIKYYCSIRL